MYRSLTVATSECHASHGAHLHSASDPLALYFALAFCAAMLIAAIVVNVKPSKG